MNVISKTKDNAGNIEKLNFITVLKGFCVWYYQESEKTTHRTGNIFTFLCINNNNNKGLYTKWDLFKEYKVSHFKKSIQYTLLL